MVELLKANLLWTEGIYILGVLMVACSIGILFFRPLLYGSVALILFSLYFFRNPERVCLQALNDKTVLICPADGKVVDVQYDNNNKLEGYAQKVSIFLSPLDVHVNWAPVDGIIQKIDYQPGAFAMAFLPKSSELNERNDVLITHKNGKTVLVRQIAGMIARRICCWVKSGQQITAGEKYGMIRFGSRVDVFLPADVSLAVGLGQRVYGGKTVLGRWIDQK